MFAALLYVISLVLGLYIGLLVVGAVLSWLVVFDLISRSNRVFLAVSEVYAKLTDPVLKPIRKVIPLVANMDFSPLVLILIIIFIREYIRTLY